MSKVPPAAGVATPGTCRATACIAAAAAVLMLSPLAPADQDTPPSQARSVISDPQARERPARGEREERPEGGATHRAHTLSSDRVRSLASKVPPDALPGGVTAVIAPQIQLPAGSPAAPMTAPNLPRLPGLASQGQHPKGYPPSPAANVGNPPPPTTR